MTGKEAVLTGVASALALLGAEAATRLLLPPPLRISDRRFDSPPIPKHIPDAELGWTIPPRDAVYRFRSSGKTGSVDVHYTIQGGHRAAAAHPVAGPALIATGCSFTFGLGLDDENTWPWLLQERIPDYHVINAGVNGYGTDQALMAAERVALHTPGVQLAVLGFGDFQIERNRGTQAVIYHPYPLGKPLFLPQGAGLTYQGLVRFWYPGALLDHSMVFMRITNKVGNLANRVTSHEGAREVTARVIMEFSRRFQAKGVRLAVIVLPHAGDQSPESKADRAFMVARLNAAKIPTLIPEFPRRPDGQLDVGRFFIPSDEIHPNREYNLLVSDQLAKFLAAGPAAKR
jgi:hypothetical protein